MIFQPTLNRRFLLMLLIIGAASVSGPAQDLTPDLIDNLNYNFLPGYAQPPANVPNFTEFLSKNRTPANNYTNPVNSLILGYGFNYKHSYLDGSATKQNSGTISFKGGLRKGFSYQIGLAVNYGDVESISDADTANSLSVNPSLQLGWTCTNLLFPSKDQISISGTVGYTSAENSSAPGAKLAFNQASGWNESISAGYAVNLNDKLQLNLKGSYAYGNNETVNDLLNTTTTTYKENVSLALGGQYAIPQAGLTFTASAKWLHDISFSLAPGQVESLQDYAEFGGGMSRQFLILQRKWNLELDYAYDAFNSSYFSHAVKLQLRTDF